MHPPEQSVNVGINGSRSTEGKSRSKKVCHLRSVELNIMNVAVMVAAEFEFGSFVTTECAAVRAASRFPSASDSRALSSSADEFFGHFLDQWAVQQIPDENVPDRIGVIRNNVTRLTGKGHIAAIGAH